MNKIQPTIWFDMDGVLSEYVTSDYVEPDPKFLEPHYFLHRTPNQKMISLLQTILSGEKTPTVLKACPNIQHVGIISKVQKEIPRFIEESTDKKEWVNTHILNPKKLLYKQHELNVLFTGSTESKAKKIESWLQRPLNQYDILIDDYNSNLENWVQHGGTAIKYGLGNKDSWNSYSFDDNLLVHDMILFLNELTRI